MFMHKKNFRRLVFASLLSVTVLAHATESCFKDYYETITHLLVGNDPVKMTAANTDVPIGRAFEKEGLMYSDIAVWFDSVAEKETRVRLAARLKDEQSKKSAPLLLNWLKEFPAKNRMVKSGIEKNAWEALTPDQQIELLFKQGNGNFFGAINVSGREKLFLDNILNYDDLRPAKDAPAFLTVGDDLGSYEVKSASGEADLRKFNEQRTLVEDELESMVGHQHIVHSWPTDPKLRQANADQYIELLDASTWYLFWRQFKRNPEDVTGIIDHPYLGVYNRKALDRLESAYLTGDAAKFKNKYRMIGARNVTGRPDLGQPAVKLPDFELRSGNKGAKRDFTENMLLSRLTSGDYAGLRSYRGYAFDASTSLEDLSKQFATLNQDELFTAKQLASLKEFEQRFPYMAYSDAPTALNHFRNKVISPLLPWENRLDLSFKQDILAGARQDYADALVTIAGKFNKNDRALRVGGKTPTPDSVSEIRQDALAELEQARYVFSQKVRLDKDFERYLMPKASQIPSVTVKPSGPVDVNNIDLGIEYSFRFPERIYSKTGADKRIGEMAANLQKWMGGGTLEKLEKGGHGHGLSVRYKLTDPKGRSWRIEWDGIKRTYEDGVPKRPRGGHIEVPSPKFAPQTPEEINILYGAARELGLDPSRHAGGAHVNIDLAPLFAMEPKVGARKMANFISFFESNRDMVAYIWEHPFRTRAAAPVDLTPSLVEKLNKFDGDWNELANLLYSEKYFNNYITRKPGYTQLNATAVMSPVVPEPYQKTIDIKNPLETWFPAFGGKGKDRVEFRLFDAQTSEYTAALQIKYVRALMDRALNTEGTVPLLTDKFPAGSAAAWTADPKKYWEAFATHLIELGLDPKEYEPLFVQSVEIQRLVPSVKAPLEPFDSFLPAMDDRQPQSITPPKKTKKHAAPSDKVAPKKHENAAKVNEAKAL